MLKKSFSILVAFFLGLIISISIIACADDISDLSNDDSIIEALMAKVANFEKEVQSLKEASITQNIESYYSYRNDDGIGEYTTIWKYEYDKTGRLTKITGQWSDRTHVWTCSYNKNVCKVTDGKHTRMFTLTDEDSQDFSKVQNILLTESISWTL